MNYQRNMYFDFLKGVLILSVLVGHSIQYGSGSAYLIEELYWENPIMKIIYSFHMPLFAIVSGYFFYFSVQKYTPVKACLRRWKKLIVPISAWVLPIILLAAIVSHSVITFKLVITTFLTNFWFLWAILIGSVLICIGELIKKKIWQIVYYLFIFIVFFITPDVLWIGAAYKFILPFYFLGFCIGKRKISLTNIAYIGGIFFVLGWIVLLRFYNKETYIYTSQFSLIWNASNLAWYNQLIIDLYRYLVGFFGCSTVAYLSILVWNWLNGRDGIFYKAILQFGKHSLAVYILSNYIYLYAVPFIMRYASPSVIVTIAVTIAVAAVCMIVTKALERLKWLSIIFLGE